MTPSIRAATVSVPRRGRRNERLPAQVRLRRDSAGFRQLLNIGVPAHQIDVVDDPLQNLRKLQAGRLDLITLQPGVLAWHARQFGIAPDSLEPVFALLPATDFQLAPPAPIRPWAQRCASVWQNWMRRDVWIGFGRMP